MRPEDAGYETDRVIQIDTNLDDLSPELIGHVSQLLLESGALDVWVTPVQMKKQRPGVLLSVLCQPESTPLVADLIFTHTSAFGLRTTEVVRWKLKRDFINVETPFGLISVKRGFKSDHILQLAPEFESCKQAALRHGVPLQVVYDAARSAARNLSQA